MYSVMSFGHMAADGVRMDAYARAIAQTVKPGDVVVDIGAGTGILSLLAARAGALRVHAVDVNPAVWLLRDLAEENGLGERIVVHQESSLELSIPERADVIVSDLRGSLPLNGEHLAIVRDARSRLLRPDGILVPAADRLMLAVVESDKLARDLELATKGFVRSGLGAGAARRSMLQTVYSEGQNSVFASDVLSTEASWATLDYATIEASPLEGTLELEIERGGRANALCVWFEAIVHRSIQYSTAPGRATAYSRMLLPLLEPVEVVAGDRATITVRADARGDRWAWESSFVGREGAAKASFRQASFLGAPTSAEELLRSSTSYTPARSDRGDRAHAMLEAMDGTRTIGDIVDAVVKETRLPREIVLEEVRDCAARFAR